ncbi:unnamed protein product [Paramecium sonneborni]|uniref:Uncharacterized protein n=1 Tax=Paramecium sonneborni TaxID=65129 RepID=A0A8S1MB38_9CILI|nr:unnamed protein product [Paramecium sonneborni]
MKSFFKLQNQIKHLQNELLKNNYYIQYSQIQIKQLNTENQALQILNLQNFEKLQGIMLLSEKLKKRYKNISYFQQCITTTETRKTNQYQFLESKIKQFIKIQKNFLIKIPTNHILQREYNKIYKQIQQLFVTIELTNYAFILRVKTKKYKNSRRNQFILNNFGNPLQIIQIIISQNIQLPILINQVTS